jgi:hypothetical protein
MMLHFYVVAYKKPTSGRLRNIGTSFSEEETCGVDPVVYASRQAFATAGRLGLLKKMYHEYGISGSFQECVQLCDGSITSVDEYRRAFGHEPDRFLLKMRKVPSETK